jgi:triosephosphate isomerase (TIM)
MRTPVIAANWKMNGDIASVDRWATGLRDCLQVEPLPVDWFYFPPAVFWSQANKLLANTGIHLGGQCVSDYDAGAYTGELSVKMLSEFGCTGALVGHSERRHLFGVSNKNTALRVKMLLGVGIIPFLCVGETLEQRESGLTLQIIQEQLEVGLSLIDNPGTLSRIVIAYEPVWAIGTGETAEPEQAQEVHACIRSCLAEISTDLAADVRVIYGGSVNPQNAQGLFAMPDIDGALVGGASLEFESFFKIGQLCY